jgi:hypothetical protein
MAADKIHEAPPSTIELVSRLPLHVNYLRTSATATFKNGHQKKTDDKKTPARKGPASPAILGDPNERQLVYNPYAQSRHPPPQQVVNEHHPSQYAHNQMDSNGNYYDGRHDALMYSQPPGQFQYTPPSPERSEDQYHNPSRDTLMNERADSHSAEDARNYASL